MALRLTDASTPAVDAADLGAMLLLAQTYDPEHPHEDVRALARLDRRSADVLRTLVEADSVRSAAAELGMHHSTVQARHEALTHTLGYDPRSNVGRMRYIAAALLLRLTDPVPPDTPREPLEHVVGPATRDRGPNRHQRPPPVGGGLGSSAPQSAGDHAIGGH